MLDGFGAYRTAGHKHAGLDIKGGFNEPVYSIGIGVVKKYMGSFLMLLF
jgi:murein DD-endopeptidase MepM/ murein hydrolase activator NlpD